MQNVGNTTGIPHYTKSNSETVSTAAIESDIPYEDMIECARLMSALLRERPNAPLKFPQDGDTPVNRALAMATRYDEPVNGMTAAEFYQKKTVSGSVTKEDLDSLIQMLEKILGIDGGPYAPDLSPLAVEVKSPNPLRSFM